MSNRVGNSVSAGLLLLAVTFGIWFIGLEAAWAEMPVKELKYSVSTSLTAGKYNFRFSLWDNAIATTVGNMLWSERKTATVSGGAITAYLGNTIPLDSDIFSRQLWVEAARITAAGKCTPIGKRGKLSVVPYALYSLANVSAITGQIGNTQIADLAVTDSKIGSVAAGKITGTISTGQIAAGAVTDSKIGSVAASKITGTISNSQIASIDASKISNLNATITAGAIDGSKLADNSVADSKISGVAASKITGLSIITNLIVNSAVTNSKIASGAVTDNKIGSVSASKITGTIGTSQIANGAVTGSKIAAGTINISNTDSSIEPGSHYTLVVAPTSGEGNYNTITAALNAITNATAAQPYLIKVTPGTYTESITLKSNVHIQGSGIGITTITNTGTDVVIFSAVKNARLSQLTVKNSASDPFRGGIRTLNCGASVVLDNVQAIGSSSNATYGIYNISSSPTISNSSATASSSSGTSIGIYNYYSSPTISNSSATASSSSTGVSYGIYNASSSSAISNCSFTASSSSGVSYGIYNASSSPTISNSSATASSSGDSYGIYILNLSSVPKVYNSVLTGISTGGGTGYAIYINGSGSTAVFTDCQLTGTTIASNACCINNITATRITGQITTTQIAAGAVTDNKIGSVAANKITGTIGDSRISSVSASKITGTIGTSQIANGAVTGSKIAAGTINISNTDTSIEAGSPYTLVVATSGGDYSSITAAMNAIGGGVLPAATAAQPYLIKVMPGTYTESVTLKSNVHIQGSGIGITTITNTGSNDVVTFSSVKNARLSQLTVKNSASSYMRGGIRTLSCGASVVLDNVQAIGSSSNVTYGIYNYYSSPTISNCSATASSSSGDSYGIYNYSSSPTVSNCSATASSGGLGYGYGIYNYPFSSPTISNSSATASSSSGSSYGIYNYYSSSPTISNCSAMASSSSGSSYGIFNDTSSPKISNSRITGSTYSIYQTTGGGGLGNCQLVGTVSTVGHLFGCYDGNFGTITNQ